MVQFPNNDHMNALPKSVSFNLYAGNAKYFQIHF